MKKAMFPIIFLCFAYQAVFSQKIDERLQAPLAALNLKYMFESNTVSFKQPVGKRSQVVYIDSDTDFFDKFEVRQVYSTIHESTKPLDQNRLQQLLVASSKKKIGAFEIIEKDGSFFVIFTAKVSPMLDAADLKSVIDMVATVADSIEERMFMTDEW